MKRITSVHLGNRVFQIEEDAYACLNTVLDGQWKKPELELEISKRLELKLDYHKVIVTYSDVTEVLDQLGFINLKTIPQQPKRLYRDPEDKMIAGVSTGLGKYFNVDPVIVRVLFVGTFFLGSMGFWVYLLLWIIVPRDPKSLVI